jgi:hypothetical protein
MSQKTRYWLVVAVAVLLSAGGIGIAAVASSPADGGRGGAVAVAFSFFMLFVRRDYGARLLRAIIDDIPKLREHINALRGGKEPGPPFADGLDELKRNVEAIIVRLDNEASGQRNQNLALAVASIIGTITWGFGDWGAQWIHKLLVS